MNKSYNTNRKQQGVSNWFQYKEFERVFVKRLGIIGTIVDISPAVDERGPLLLVESEQEGPIEGLDDNSRFPIIDCFADDIEKL